MADNRDHEKRRDLYAKAKNTRPEGELNNTGIFVVKNPSNRRSRSGKTIVNEQGGTKWLPPKGN